MTSSGPMTTDHAPGPASGGADLETLRWLLHPLPLDRFFSDHWERSHFHGRRGDETYHAGLLSLRDIDGYLADLTHFGASILLTNAGEPVPREKYATESDRIDSRRVILEHARGATIIFNQLQDYIPSLFRLCRSLELETGARVQTNIYLTPHNAQGFATHYDNHDVVILQIHGAKRWKIYGAPIEMPLQGQRFEKGRHQAGDAVDTFDLMPGDFLYIPRGVMHEAVSDDRLSLHITTGIISTTWNDVLFECLAAFNLSHAAVRGGLPWGSSFSAEAAARVAATIKDMAAKFAREADGAAALRRLHQAFLLARRPGLDGQLMAIPGIDAIGVDTVVRRRDGLAYTLEQNGDTVVLTSWGVQLELPAHAADAVRAALDPPTIRVGDLAGDLDDEGKVTLVRRLMREGLLQPA